MVEDEIADKVIFGKEISKIANDFKKHKRFGFMTLLQCEKKPLRGEMYDDIIFGTQCCNEFQVPRMKMTL